AQPEAFANAFSGFWWAANTLLTVGYGDIIPVTLAGKICGTVLTFLGVGMVAIPTGILSAGFMEQVSIVRERAVVEGFIEDVRHVQEAQAGTVQHSYNYCPHCGKELPK
ncbi:MAG: two pore domain potassium channel family protein, partial [Firmicutes bacterium]|nr:two pore domain potassium channel family protein [Bacillota bacterium]